MALWAFVALVLVRGIGDVLAGAGEGSPAPLATVAPVWPDDGARAFAVRFAREYLSWRSGGAESGALAAMAAPELRDQLAPAGAGARGREPASH